MEYTTSLKILALCLCLSWANLTALEQQDEYTRVQLPGIKLSLMKPKGFDKAEAFHGFQQQSSGSSILVSVIPGPFSEVTKGFVESKLAPQGIEVISRDETEIDNQSALLLYLSQHAHGQQYHKWVAVFGDATQTQLVSASFPAFEAEHLRDSMRKVVLSAMLTKEAVSTPVLPFSIGQVNGLSAVNSIAGVGKMVIFTKDGSIPIASPIDPYFVVGPSLGDLSVGDHQEFAMQRLKNSANTAVNNVAKISNIRIDGLDGVEIQATGRDRQSGKELRFYQVMLFPQTGGYILMSGVVGVENADFGFSKFQTLAKTYRSKSSSDH